MGSPVILRALSTTVAALTFATIILFVREKLALSTVFRPLPQAVVPSKSAPPSFDASQFVLQDDSSQIHPSLLRTKYYITAWAESTWTNTFVAQLNVIYLGILTNRVPVLPAFTPSDSDASIPFSRVFDVERFWQERGIPLIDWADVRDGVRPGANLGCWSVAQTTNPSSGADPSLSSGGAHPNVEYTKVPEWTVFANAPHFVKFSSLSRLSFPEGRRRAIGEAGGPDKQLMCFDSLLPVGEDDQWEWENDYSPVWNLVGKHLHFHPDLVKIAQNYLAKIFGATKTEDIPSFITVHVRSNGTHTPTPSVSSLARLVNDLEVDIASISGTTITSVLVFSDELDEEWWKEIFSQGWTSVDHVAARTARLHGASLIPIIDAVIQSMSAGLVRTSGSTFGLMSQRRVQDWSEGPTRLIVPSQP